MGFYGYSFMDLVEHEYVEEETTQVPYLSIYTGLAKSRLFVQKATQAVKTGKNQFLPVFTAKFAFAAKIARNWFKRYSGPYSVV